MIDVEAVNLFLWLSIWGMIIGYSLAILVVVAKIVLLVLEKRAQRALLTKVRKAVSDMGKTGAKT